MANITFKRGLRANLPSAITDGTMYLATDERSLYVDIDSSTRIRIGDFQEFETLAALQANQNPSTTALYYIKDINVLAKYNGTGYTQINLDTGATSVEVVGEGNAVTNASYDAQSRKLTLTMGATYTTADDVDAAIGAAIGNLGNNDESQPYETVKEYVDDKVADVVAGSIEGLGAMAAKDNVAESDLEATLATKINGKADVGTDDDEATADTVKGAKKYAEAEADAAETAAKAYADGLIAGLDVTDEAVANQFVTAVSEADGKVSVTRRAMTADDVPTLAISKVEGLQTALDGKAAAADVTTLIGSDTGKSARTIANEELAAQLIPEDAAESLNTLQEIADWIQDHPDDASAMNTAISALQTKVDTGEQTVSAYVTAAIAALNIGDYATAANLTALAGRVTTLEGATHTHANKELLDTYTQTEADLADAVAKKHTHANATVLDGITSEKVTAWDAAEQNAKDYADGLAGNYDAVGSAATAESNAKSYADGLASNYDAAGSAAGALEDAKEYVDTAMTWGSF